MTSPTSLSSIHQVPDSHIIDIAPSKPNGASERPDVRPAKDSFMGSTLSFLANVPLLKSLPVIKAYTQQLASANTASVTSFIRALSDRFGTDATVRAVEITGLKPGTPLTDRKIQALEKQAEIAHLAGESKHLARNVNLRVWEQHGTAPGHVSVSMRNGMGLNGVVFEKINATKEHVSWWPGDTKGSNPFERVVAAPNINYKQDKSLEISDRAAKALKEGKYLPRLGQKLVSQGNWGMSAKSVPAPLMGANFNYKTGQAVFTTFGLNEKAFKADWMKAQIDNLEGKIGYQMASVDQNCAGMAARVLKAAGAEVFAPIPKAYIVQDPNSMKAYGITLQREMNAWNAKANQVSTFCSSIKPQEIDIEAEFDKLLEATSQTAPSIPRFAIGEKADKHEAKAGAVTQAINQLPPEQAALCAQLKKALTSRKTANSQEFIPLMQQAKDLVNALHPLAMQSSANISASAELKSVIIAANDLLEDVKSMAFEVSRQR